jgi:5-histidylcysteine sulfoxide synthase/putative 4-mercaptohistidine N1-methyltranferase
MIITKNISLNGTDAQKKKEEIKEYFLQTYELYERLFDYLSCDESYYQRADSLRHPLIFYFGHTASFFINKLNLAKIINTRVNPLFESIFAVGVDEMSWDDLDEKHYEWPTVGETKEYREAVKEVVLEVIDRQALTLPILWESPFWAILMGIEHERIHLETSAVLIRQLPLKFVKENFYFVECKVDNPLVQNSLVSVPKTTVNLGKNRQSDLYGWDNEYGTHKQTVEAFEASKYLVSNAEYLEFVKEGGYEDDSLWCKEGIRWKAYENVLMPRFWRQKADGYYLRVMSSEVKLPLSWPVEVNNLEAQAFCAYKSKKLGKKVRLLSEDEYQALRVYTNIQEEQSKANINLEGFGSASPVDIYDHGDFYDVIGNVWQHTCTPIYGFDGFKVHPWYDDFSTPTFDDRHNLLMGGSWISTGNEIQKSARYAFRRHFYQFAGIRYIYSDAKPINHSATYEKDFEISSILHASWSDDLLGLLNYYKALADFVKSLLNKEQKALEVGCDGGRCTLELSSALKSIQGIDTTARVIANIDRFLTQKSLSYALKGEGDFETLWQVKVEDFDFADDIENVEFWQADIANLKPIFKEYDIVILNDILTRSYDPKKALENITDRINKDGLLIIASSDEWDEKICKRQNWLGGVRKNGEQLFAKDHIESLLKESFALQEQSTQIQRVVQKSQNSYEVKNLWVKVWKKL